MKLSSILLLYRLRLRTRIVQELFAVVGIAVGVALLFASQVASTSLDGSVRQLTKGIVGDMRFQLAARSPQGFDQRILGEVQSLPGVRAAEPVLEAKANVIGPTGQRSVNMVGTDPRFARLAGPLLHHFTATQLTSQRAFALPAPIAQSIGLLSLSPVEIEIGGRIVHAFLGAELLRSDIGSLIDSPVALAPLAYAQRLAGLEGRLNRIFVRPAPGRDREVHEGLTHLAGGSLDVRPANFDATLFSQAAGPTNQSALLFSAISALVGFLFAFNAILLTVPQRRRLVEDLRLDGYPRRSIVAVILLDGLILGVVASLLGLLLGDALSLIVFHANPGYLSFAFPIGSQRILTWQCFAIAVGGGMLAACVGVLLPLWADVFGRLSLAGSYLQRGYKPTSVIVATGLACLAITTLILLVMPQAAIVGIVSLVIALLLLLPVLLQGVVLLFDRLQAPVRGAAPYLAVVELRSPGNRARSLAIAATGAIAVMGSVAIQGAGGDLQRGLDNSAHDIAGITDLWATPPGTQNLLATAPFHAGAIRTLERLPGVSSVRLYRAGFLDYGSRRVWVIAPPSASTKLIPATQILSGDLARASAHLREGGWAVVSQAIANDRHLSIGQSFTLPSPRPTSFRVAALSTNIGWPPGAIILNADDYARAWGSTDPSAYNIVLAPGTSLERGRSEVSTALAGSGLVVETAQQREQNQREASRQGLSRLTQISVLVLIAAVLAMAAAMCAMIWQRRSRLADMKVDGFSRDVLWRALLVESALLLGAGCSIGGVFGLYGQLLLSHALANVTGFPVVFSLGALVAISSFALVTAVAVAIVALPGYLAARVRPALSLYD
ncbi:MAG TPA: FtsX-like permease family protein [Solirubrobacteraceae bacterium]|jgi:putative ABC transport system permease protein|nr:FtsX-like permease family protein [Solirubrobacteraceae bacterium]